MNAIQFQTALLEANQRARTAIGAFMEAMTPPQIPQGAGQNAPNTQPQLQGQEIGQRPNPAGPDNLPPG